MSTKSLIDQIQPYASGWSRTGSKGLLTLIQQAQDFLFDYDSPYMHFLSTDNKGFPPYLKTTATIYQYDISNANLSATLTKTIGGTAYTVRCRQVLAIFVDTSTNYNYARSFIGETYLHAFNNPYRTSNDSIKFAKVPFTQNPALENTVVNVMFLEDPGTHTDVYFIDFLWEPPRLTAETVPLIVPALYETAIRKYVIGTIQELENGQSSNQLKEFFEYWVPKFRNDVCVDGTYSPDAVLVQF